MQNPLLKFVNTMEGNFQESFFESDQMVSDWHDADTLTQIQPCRCWMAEVANLLRLSCS